MSRVHCNPEAVKEFQRNLKSFTRESNDRLRVLKSKLQSLGSSEWTDDKFRQYESLFEITFQTLHTALEGIENEHLPYMDDVIRKAEEYHT